MNSSGSDDSFGSIAIIGLSGRFPGAGNIDEFWTNLRDGVESISFFSDQELAAAGIEQEVLNNPRYVKAGSFLADTELFDASFFGLSPREAQVLDPQHRLFMESAWEALESSGYTPEAFDGQIGVYAGASLSTYLLFNLYQSLSQPGFVGSFQTLIGNDKDYLATHVSYKMNLKGPSVGVQTACSTSLVAVCLACQGLLSYQCEMALAGGVTVRIPRKSGYFYEEGAILSPDGHCRTFDARAQGTVFGSGVGVVVLKRLEDAIKAGDHIHAVIKGSAINNDGSRKIGFTAPGAEGQAKVIVMAHALAGVNPETISYVETHGTGTALGDPIEIDALTQAFRAGTTARNFCALGSVKTNFGHLESAAGIASLIKTVLALENKQLPPSLNFEQPNPEIDFTNSPFYVNAKLAEWKAGGTSRRAGVSSFGIGGTNAHVVLEEAPPRETVPVAPERPLHLLTLSAKTEPALKQLAQRFSTYLSNQPTASLADICFTANTGRAHFSHRLAVTTGSITQASAQLAAFAGGQPTQDLQSNRFEQSSPPRIAFLFTGQGSQYPGMGSQLFATQPTFRRRLQECDELLRPHLEHSLLSVLYGEQGALLAQTAYTQPALFALEYALAELWRSWGIEPDVVLGHSVGEYVAACVAGVFTLSDGLRLLAARGRLMQSVKAAGGMAAVFADEARVRAAIAPYTRELSIAALNTPGQVVISGARAAMAMVLQNLSAQAVRAEPLHVSHAFHSPLMDEMLDEFSEAAAAINYRAPRLKLISNVTGMEIGKTEVMDADYWRRQVSATVQFCQGMQTMVAQGAELIVEVGPTATLIGMGRQCVAAAGIEWLPSLRKGRDDWPELLAALARLYLTGAKVQWSSFDSEHQRHRVVLPTYPFQRERYWIDPRDKPAPAAALLTNSGTQTKSALLGTRLLSALDEVQYESQLSSESPAFLREHQVYDRCVMPAAAFVEMALAAAPEQSATACEIERLAIHEPLVFSEGTARTVQTILQPEQPRAVAFRILSWVPGEEREGSWQLHVTGKLHTEPANIISVNPESCSPKSLLTQGEWHSRDTEKFYQNLAERGIHLGPSFRCHKQLWIKDNEAIAQLRLDEAAADLDHHHLHTCLIDSCFQLLGAALPAGRLASDAYAPVSLERFRFNGRAGDNLWGHAVLRPGTATDAETFVGDIRLVDDAGNSIGEVTGLCLQRATPEALLRSVQPDSLPAKLRSWLYEIAWRPQPLAKANLSDSATRLATAAGDEDMSAQVTRLSSEHGLDLYQQLLPELDTLSVSYVWRALHQLGWIPHVNEQISLPSLAQSLRIVPQHQRLLGRMLEMLEEDGVLRQSGSNWEVLRIPQVADTKACGATLLQRYPFGEAEITLLERCGEPLAQILSGALNPLQVLFPGGSLKALEKLYQDSPASRVYNTLVQHALWRSLEHFPQDKTLRILEVGAGTGSTTSYVLERFANRQLEYVFTDLSPLFLTKAAQKFKAHKFLRYQLLDIERDPEEQGFAQEKFDVIVAANVLHATSDLRQTLRHTQQLLAEGGQLVLLEGTSRQRWVDLTFGLTEGWWKFTDTELRPNYALLNREQWQAVLAELGFSDLVSIAGEEIREGLSQPVVILARAGGKPAEIVAPARAARMLIFADRSGVGEQLAKELRKHGEPSVLVYAGAQCEEIAPGQWQIDPTDAEAFERVIEQASGSNGDTCLGVAHLWNLDNRTAAETTVSTLEEDQRVGCGSVLNAVQAIVRSGTAKAKATPRLWVVTRGAQAVAGSTIEVAQSPVWGLGQVIAQEHPDLHCVRLDLDPANTGDEIQALIKEIQAKDKEDQIALRQEIRYAARLVRPISPPRIFGTRANAPTERPQQLGISQRGLLDNLILKPMTRRPPGDEEIEIRVRATGLNFRDVLNALGMRPEDSDALGGECAGEIVALGKDVNGFAVGDQVIALASASFSTFVTTHCELVAAKPESLSFTEAATIPVVFLTAHYALQRLGKITARDRVLIHAAAGGVGLAAVQLAQRAGTEIFATAGSDDKRAFLSRLGIDHVLDSRSVDFAEEILKQTGGKGVDMVLNSLAGEFIPASLSVLARGGRFLEIGKSGIWSDSQVAHLDKDIAYFVIELDKLMVTDPAYVGAMFRELLESFAQGTLKPLPNRVFDIHDSVAAFRYMAQAKHIGKIVVSQANATMLPALTGAQAFPRDSTYLITGGLGGLGLVIARRLIERGARNLVLVGRRPASAAALAAVSELEKPGARVVVAQADVSREQEIARVLGDISESMPPLRGIIHAAGVLDDGVLLRQNWTRFAGVMAPKVSGSWNLHLLTKGMPLDFFVLFSSSASMLGSPGQGNHAAANTFLDKLAHYRRAQGLPALSINWGGWASVGAAARRKPDLQSRSMGSISKQQGLQLLDHVLGSDSTQIGVLPIDWPEFFREFSLAGKSPLFEEIAKEAGRKPPQETASQPILLRQLEQARPRDRYELLITHVGALVFKLLALDPSQAIDRHRPLNEFGLDSLMAIELRNSLGVALGQSLPATLLFDYPTIDALTNYLATSVLALELSDTPEPTIEMFHPRQDRETATEALAIIGVGCRFPGGAETPEGYWQLLRNGVDAVTEVPADRWDIEAYYDSRPGTAGKMNTRYGAFIGPVDQFDPQFFGIAPREAISMDPQQRLVLEVAWEALEQAGQAPDKLVGSATGVFIGISNSDYARLVDDPGHINTYTSTGISLSIAAGRLSYVLGLQGPSLAVDTACSSSLVAIHLACQSLRQRECRMAIAGGVNLLLSPLATISLCELSMMAPDGRCKTFDQAANGFVRGEGCGLVVLKRLSDALADGDSIMALVRGTAINQDGRSSGLTAPNGPSQEAVIRQALADGRVAPEQVSYVEAHGTGTALGDPIEVAALGAVLGAQRSAEYPLMIGSVKTNIGHLEAAAGVSGLIKVVLALQHGEVPPHLHLQVPSPHISWASLPVVVPTVSRPWPSGNGRRLAGVSSFGFGGTNAHVVLEEAPPRETVPVAPERPLHLLTLSAKTEPALKQLAQRFSTYLSNQPTASLADICFTANTGRAHFSHRLAVTTGSITQASAQLAAFAGGQPTQDLQSNRFEQSSPPRIAFLFTGQGSQYPGMGSQLFATQPTFRRRLQECDELLRPHLEHSLLSVLYGEQGALLAQTAYTQPALFALEYALAELWRSWGIEPDVVLGHSVGEYVAACVAGVFTLSDGLRLLAARGRLMQSVKAAGGMAAVFADEARVRAAIAPYTRELSIAALNTPGQVVISGARAAMAMVLQNLSAQAVRAEPLHVSHAFHSPLMDEMLDEFSEAAAAINYRAPRLKLISNVTGMEIGKTEVMDADYWRRQVSATVQFCQGMQTMVAQGAELIVEVGPTATLIGMGRQCVAAAGIEWLPSLRKGRDDWPELLAALARLYLQGVTVNWQGFEADYKSSRRLVALPSYPFQRRRYWIEAEHSRSSRVQPRNGKAEHPLLGHKLRSPLPQLLFESELSSQTTGFLTDHQLFGAPVMPAAAYLEMALTAATEIYGPAPKVLEDVAIHEVMVLHEDEERTVQFILHPESEGHSLFQISSWHEEATDKEGSWVLQASGKIRVGEVSAAAQDADATAVLQLRCHEEIAGAEFYQRIKQAGLQFGSNCRAIEKLWRQDGEALAQIVLPKALSSDAELYQFHPVLLDAALQLFAATLPDNKKQNGADTYLLTGLERFYFYHRPSTNLNSHAVMRPDESGDGRTLVGNVRLFDEQGRVVAEVKGLRVKRASRTVLLQALGQEEQQEQSSSALLRQLEKALPKERFDLLASHVETQVIKVLGLDAVQAVERNRPLNEFGLDSLMAVELRNALGIEVGYSLPATLLFDYPTIDALTKYLATSVLALQLSAPHHREPAGNGDEWAEFSARLEALPEDELAALLTAKLAAIESEVNQDE